MRKESAARSLKNFASIAPACIAAISPPEDISIREHAEKNLYLVAGKNPFPGLVSFAKTPYLYEPLDALMPDNGIEKVVIMKGWQTGGTLGMCQHFWDSAKESLRNFSTRVRTLTVV